MLTIHEFKPDAQCDYTGRTGESVEISTADGSIQHAVIALPQLGKLLRFRHRQEERLSAAPKPPAGSTKVSP